MVPVAYNECEHQETPRCRIRSTLARPESRHYRYQFAAKHHGGGKADDARWVDDVSRDEEFSVFDEADFRDILDDDGRLYGVLRGADGKLRYLGTWKQKIAEFPRANEGIAWHGYPIWC